MVFTVALLVTLVVIAILSYILKDPKFYKAIAKFSGPPGLPLIGNALLFAGNNEHILKTIMNILNEYSSPVRITLGHKTYLIIYEPEHMKAVLNSPKTMEKNDIYTFVEPWAATGLVLAPVSIWKRHRKLINPTFNQRILDTFIPVFDQQSKVLVKQWSSKIETGEFEILKSVAMCTLDMICETSMGVTMNAQVDPNSLYSYYVEESCKLIVKRIVHFWLHPDFIFNRTKLGKFQRESIKFIHDFTDEVIRKKREEHQRMKDNNANRNVDEDIPATRKNFLDLLLEQDGEKLPDKELRDEVTTMVNVGFDTTASANTFVLLMLALHPEVQDKVYEEISDVFAQKSSKNECLTNEDLQKMQYLERVIKETIRIFTITPVFGRRATEDFELDGKLVPKGTSILLAYIKTHRDENYWPDPLKFDPDRFLPEEVAKRHPYSHIPFAAGPRNCIGWVYGMMSMKTLLANVLKEYIIKKDKFTRVEDIRLQLDLVLRAVDPVEIKIEKRVK